MNILFLTLANIDSIEDRGIYPDLFREFVRNGHIVSIVSPIEKSYKKNNYILHGEGWNILKLKIGDMQKNNFIKKGINTILLEHKFINGIKKHYFDKNFDLVIYSTPPITFAKVVKYVKKKYNAKTYLLLKDIFPQNAVDLDILSKKGIKGIIYKYFRRKEKQLYLISEYIGCMSEANKEYLLENNKYIDANIVHIAPNCIEVVNMYDMSEEEVKVIKEKYKLPINKKILVYGGNLGKPQGVEFIIECIKKCKKYTDIFFLIIGEGTEKYKLIKYLESKETDNVTILNWIKPDEYNNLLSACDVGLIFLDHRFTIPNFPSRLLSYMQARIPVIAATDLNTDVGDIIEKGEFGYKCESNNVESFLFTLEKLMNENYKCKGNNGYNFLKRHYTSEIVYKIINNSIT